MIEKVTRSLVALLFMALLGAPVYAAGAQAQQKAQKEQAKEKAKKNSDVDNIGNRNINSGSINFSSLEKEIALGRQLSAEIERQVKLIEDPTINEYVNRVGQNLVRNSDAKVPFTIKVVESDEINAFALPGGFFYVNSGLILALMTKRNWPALWRTRLPTLPPGTGRRTPRKHRSSTSQRFR